jgi:hypothetical protein
MQWNRLGAGLVVALLIGCGTSSGDGEVVADLRGSDDAQELVPTPSPCAKLEDGTFCDDKDPCTFTDLCQAGECVGKPYSCDWGECAAGQCDGLGGCGANPVAAGWCYVDDLCLADGAPMPDNPCLICDAASPEEAVFAPAGTPCQDDNICTENDFCDNGDCLAGSPPTCADGIQCTIDSCDVELGCLHEPEHEVCNDNNPCTVDECDIENGDPTTGCLSVADDGLSCADKDVCTTNDHCDNGACVSDPEPLSCDDGNECTDESCHPAYGCLYVFNEIPCSDGAVCTLNDVCHFGKCVGEEQWWGACPACELTFSEQAVKIVDLRVGNGGFPGEALNVDNDLKTCSPSGNCEQGLDNSLMLAGDFIDDTIAQNLVNVENPLIFAAEFVDPSFAGEEFLLNIYYATVADSNPTCDFQHEVCEYDVSGLNFDPLCNNQVTFANATIVENELNAGGSGFIFPFKASFTNGESTETVLYSAKVKAELVVSEGKVVGMTGVIGGAITKENLIELIMAIPEEYIPVDPSLIVAFVENIPQDIDLDGDGTPDASSIALVFQTIPATLLPYYH